MAREWGGGLSDGDVAEEPESRIGGEFVEFMLTVLVCESVRAGEGCWQRVSKRIAIAKVEAYRGRGGSWYEQDHIFLTVLL